MEKQIQSNGLVMPQVDERDALVEKAIDVVRKKSGPSVKIEFEQVLSPLGWPQDTVDLVFAQAIENLRFEEGEKSKERLAEEPRSGTDPNGIDEERLPVINFDKLISYVIDAGVRYNLFNQKLGMTDGRDMDDRIFWTLYVKANKKYRDVSAADLKAVIKSHYVPEVDPVRDAFLRWSELESESELKRFLDCLEFDQSAPVGFLKHLIVKWLMQLPAMAIDTIYPRLVWVLIGESHIGKTTLLRKLLPEDIKDYYTESELNREKDSMILLSENLMINVDEFGGLAKMRPELFKHIVSAEFFKERRPYGYFNQKFTRRAVLCGTSNTRMIIADHAAMNTRIIPCVIKNYDREAFNKIDKRLLMGEITRLYRESGPDSIRLSPQEAEQLGEYSKGFMVHSTEHDMFADFIEPGETFVPTIEIIDYLSLHLGKRVTPRFVGPVLDELSIQSDRRRINGVQKRGYLVNFLKGDIVPKKG